MNNWSGINSLAKKVLNVEAPQAVDLAKIDRQLSPQTPHFTNACASPNNTAPVEVIPEYRFILEAIENDCPAIFVTGRAGTGKSTLIRFLSRNIKNCAIVAPTALAAINIQGSTIHSFFNIPPRTINPEEVFDPRQHIIPVISRLAALIIDEISMVTPNLIDCISNTLKVVRDDQRPFGGVPVIFVGDLLQLPPVVSNAKVAQFFTDRYRSPYFFSADVFNETEIMPIELTRVFRQDSREFIDILDRIRLNYNHRDAVARINRDCYRDRQPDSRASLFLVPTNAAASYINKQKLDELESDTSYFDAIVKGHFNVQEERFQAPHKLELKIGAQVLFVKNNRPYWLNGTLGLVKNIEKNIIRVELQHSGNTVSVERELWEKIQYDYDRHRKRIISKVIGSFKQFPLNLGWAITIHKSQGMTLDSVRIDLGKGAFCSGQTYVALSRSKTLDGIQLDRPISMKDVKADQTILDFYHCLQPLRNENQK